MKKIFALLLTFWLMLMALPATSHHSFPGIYDVGQVFLLEGVVTKFMFRNPHSFIFLKSTTDDGRTAEWHLELPPAWAMKRFGVQKGLISVDDELLVACNPARDGAQTCGVGRQGGFIRKSDELLYGKDPRKVENPANR